MMGTMTVILQVIVLICLLGVYIILMERNVNTKAISEKIKRWAVIICAALALTKLGRNVFVLLAIILIGIIVLVKGNKHKKNVRMGS